MSLRDSLVGVVDSVRELYDTFDLRRYSVVVQKRVWTGAEVGLGDLTIDNLTITPTPKIYYPTPYSVFHEGGEVLDGDLWLSKISATYTLEELGYGYGEECVWLVGGAAFRLIHEPEKRNFEWRVRLRRMNR